MIATFEQLFQFVEDQLETAEEAAKLIRLSEEKSIHFSRNASLISHIPRFLNLAPGYGEKAWAAILFVDLRNSSKRADELGPKATYLTMHSYLPTMAYLVGEFNGHIVGFRGDGLFASFGLDETGKNPPGPNGGETVRLAVRCAKAMIEAVDEIVSPALAKYDVPADLEIGVGIDMGSVVITRIGLRGAFDITAYGSAVNKAAHFSGGNGAVIISSRARNIYPKKPGGSMCFKPYHAGDGLRIIYPNNYRALPRPKVRSVQR